MVNLLELVEEMGTEEVRKVYLLKIRFRKGDGYKVLYKIGIAKDPVARVSQIATSFFQKRRYFPEIEIKRARSTTKFFDIETMFHREFKDRQWDFKGLKFDGCTEIFDLEEIEETVLARFEEECPKSQG